MPALDLRGAHVIVLYLLEPGRQFGLLQRLEFYVILALQKREQFIGRQVNHAAIYFLAILRGGKPAVMPVDHVVIVGCDDRLSLVLLLTREFDFFFVEVALCRREFVSRNANIDKRDVVVVKVFFECCEIGQLRHRMAALAKPLVFIRNDHGTALSGVFTREGTGCCVPCFAIRREFFRIRVDHAGRTWGIGVLFESHLRRLCGHPLSPEGREILPCAMGVLLSWLNP